MNKATKATINRLKKMARDCKAAEILLEIAKEASIVEEAVKEFPDADYSIIHNRLVRYEDNGLHIAATTYEKPYLRGISTRYPGLIDCTFTHGNNECIIRDINKLAREMQTA